MKTNVPVELHIPANELITTQGKDGQPVTKVHVTLAVLVQCPCAVKA